tara:strand:+ start:720 stop:1607 length:888 start_codon:yes stop_codon:yes gene_type:complete
MLTGVNGIVGREIANQLIKNKEYELFFLSNSKINIKSKKKIKLLKQDLTKPIRFQLKTDAIIHCASKTPLSKVGGDMKKIYDKNIKITKNLIKFSNKNNVKKIIFLSSMNVYGLIKKRVVTENFIPNKPCLYGKSKFFSEKLFNKKKNKFKTISLRIPGVFTVDLSRNQPLIINILKKIMNNENVYAYNLNSGFNNITDTYEIVKLIDKILKRKRIKTSVYNFSASKPIKVIDMINSIKKIFKSKSKIITRKLSKKSFIISSEKIRKDFNIEISSTKNIIDRCCKKILKKSYAHV